MILTLTPHSLTRSLPAKTSRICLSLSLRSQSLASVLLLCVCVCSLLCCSQFFAVLPFSVSITACLFVSPCNDDDDDDNEEDGSSSDNDCGNTECWESEAGDQRKTIVRERNLPSVCESAFPPAA